MAKEVTSAQAKGLIFMAALMWSTGGLLVKFVEGNPLVIAGLRALISLPAFLMLFPPRTLRFTKRAWLFALFPAGTSTLYIVANKLTTAANAVVLQYVSPVFIILLTWLVLKERPRRADVLVCGGAVVGIFLFFLDGLSTGGMLGNVLALLSGLCVAAYYLCMSRSSEDVGTIMVCGQLEIILFTLPFWFLYPPTTFSATSWVCLLIMGLVQKGVAEGLYGKGARHCSALDAILISTAEPLLNPVWVMLFYGEVPAPMAVVGGVVVIASVASWNVYKVRSARETGLIENK